MILLKYNKKYNSYNYFCEQNEWLWPHQQNTTHVLPLSSTIINMTSTKSKKVHECLCICRAEFIIEQVRGTYDEAQNAEPSSKTSKTDYHVMSKICHG